MSLVTDIHNPAIDDVIRSSLESESNKLEWVPCLEISDIKSSPVDVIQYVPKDTLLGRVDETMVMMVLLGSNEICTPAFVSEFARIYTLPTHKYCNYDSQFRRYSTWLFYRNSMIKGFTKYKDNYYLVAHNRFYHCYSRYGFCSICGTLRCSPVWCKCGHKELSDKLPSIDRRLYEHIKKSQIQTSSANEAYLEWIPYDCINQTSLDGLPTNSAVKLIPLELADETDKSYHDKLCDENPDILTTNVWVTVGITYNASEQKYYLIRDRDEKGLCLACTLPLGPKINTFCFECKAPALPDWTTGNKSLDSFIMESWGNTNSIDDNYIQWIEYSRLTNVRQMTLLRHGCTHIADRTELVTKRVTLEKIADKHDTRKFDFYQLTEEYPEILTPDNNWIIGITQEPSTKEYYLVLYYNVPALLDKFIQTNEYINYIQHTNFDEIKQIGVGGYGTVYTAKCKSNWIPEIVVLKRSNTNTNGCDRIFISEFRNHVNCSRYASFLKMYGFTQDPETKEYMIVMQYANRGNLLSYLDQNINKLTWKMKLQCFKDILSHLNGIHLAELVHCDLHSGNIIVHAETEKDFQPSKLYICDLGLSRSVNSRASNSTVRGVLPFIAPEVFNTCKFTKESDIYSFGIIAHLMATGEPPFRDREFDRSLVCDIMGGLRPMMPDPAPTGYKKIAEWCCDADPDKRPSAWELWVYINKLITQTYKDSSWNTIYHNEVRPLSRLEKENKYSSMLLPIEDLPKPRNSWEMSLQFKYKDETDDI